MWILFWVCVGNLYIMFPVKPPFVSLHVQYMQYQIQIFHTTVVLQRSTCACFKSTTLGGIYTRRGWNQTGMSLYQSPYNFFFHAFSWEWPKNELRLVWLCLGHWPNTSYLCTSLRPYRSHEKLKWISDWVHINSMFLHMAPSILLFLGKNRNSVLLRIKSVNKT